MRPTEVDVEPASEPSGPEAETHFAKAKLGQMWKLLCGDQTFTAHSSRVRQFGSAGGHAIRSCVMKVPPVPWYIQVSSEVGVPRHRQWHGAPKPVAHPERLEIVHVVP